MLPNNLPQKLEKYLESDTLLQQVSVYTKQRFDSASNLTAHNWEHIYRDTLNAIAIGEAEKADMTIVLPAIIMHDIGFLYGATGKTHGAIGAEKLPEYLKEGGIIFSTDMIDLLADCIRTHKGSMHGEVPETLEAKIVADADLLEKFGPFGIYQGLRTFGEFNYPIDKIIERLELTSELQLQTKTGQKFSESGRALVIDFARRLKEANKSYKE